MKRSWTDSRSLLVPERAQVSHGGIKKKNFHLLSDLESLRYMQSLPPVA